MEAPVKREPERKDELPDLAQLVIATVGALMVGVLYIAMPQRLIVGPNWLLLLLEALLLAPALVSVFFRQRPLPYRLGRTLAVLLLAVLTAALIGSVALMVAILPSMQRGPELLKPAGLLWVSNILVFAMWYWETDGNGPKARLRRGHKAVDFQFPQQLGGNPTGWRSGFVDYLFLAFCTATALSPADTMPLTRRAKVLMMLEAVVSLLVLILLVARSVNII
ncbi:MAG TPA: hypothetical protein VGS80_09435 [Ktedonobacterales bacterium]|nr:hypothetical protein [Ktedonobacterales bacterium]